MTKNCPTNTRFYSFISQIIPYSDQELEMLYSYYRELLTHLSLYEDAANPHPEKEVALQYYRLEKMMSGTIVLEGKGEYGVKSPTAVGTSKSKDERIIQTAKANSLDKFELGIKAIIESLIMHRMTENDGIVTRYMEDTDFQGIIFPYLAKAIYTAIHEKQA